MKATVLPSVRISRVPLRFAYPITISTPPSSSPSPSSGSAQKEVARTTIKTFSDFEALHKGLQGARRENLPPLPEKKPNALLYQRIRDRRQTEFQYFLDYCLTHYPNDPVLKNFLIGKPEPATSRSSSGSSSSSSVSQFTNMVSSISVQGWIKFLIFALFWLLTWHAMLSQHQEQSQQLRQESSAPVEESTMKLDDAGMWVDAHLPSSSIINDIVTSSASERTNIGTQDVHQKSSSPTISKNATLEEAEILSNYEERIDCGEQQVRQKSSSSSLDEKMTHDEPEMKLDDAGMWVDANLPSSSIINDIVSSISTSWSSADERANKS